MKTRSNQFFKFLAIIGICLSLAGMITIVVEARMTPGQETQHPLLTDGGDRAGGTISGEVTCLGFISDAVNEVFVDLHTDISAPPETSIHITCNQPFEITDIPDGTYYVGAWLDENDSGSGPPDDGEPHAWYGAPDPLVISSGEPSYSNVDLVLARYVERVSLFDDKGDLVERDWVSEDASISADGRFVVFYSRNQTYTSSGVFIFDRESNTPTTFGALDFGSFFYAPDISADGNFVTVAYRYDPAEGDSIERLVIKEWAVEPENVTVIEPWETNSPYFDAPSISGDGCRVAFEFKYEDISDNDVRDIYLYDCNSEETTLISVAANGVDPGNGQSYNPAISDDGRFVAFQSRATDLLEDPPSMSGNLFYVRDIEAGTTELIPLPEGVYDGDYFYGAPSISANGRFVAFEYNYDIFVHDRDTRITKMISLINGQPSGYSEYPSISGDGRFVSCAYYYQDENEDWFGDLNIYDLQTGFLKVATKGLGGEPDVYPEYTVISSDGLYVTFESEASDLVVDDTNGTKDVFGYVNQPSSYIYLPIIIK